MVLYHIKSKYVFLHLDVPQQNECFLVFYQLKSKYGNYLQLQAIYVFGCSVSIRIVFRVLPNKMQKRCLQFLWALSVFGCSNSGRMFSLFYKLNSKYRNCLRNSFRIRFFNFKTHVFFGTLPLKIQITKLPTIVWGKAVTVFGCSIAKRMFFVFYQLLGLLLRGCLENVSV